MQKIKKKIAILFFCTTLILAGCSYIDAAGRFFNTLGGGAFEKNYDGPILSLDALSDITGIQAERIINYDFSNYQDSLNVEDSRIVVSDAYTLTNTTSENITVKAVYGFPAALINSQKLIPDISVNGQPISTAFVSGRDNNYYAELRKNAGEEDANDLYTLHNYECYQKLLSNGQYMIDAFEEIPVLSEHTYVYKFADIGYGGDNEEIETPYAEVKYSYKNAAVFTYGQQLWDGSYDEIKKMGIDVPIKGDEDFGKDVYMIVVGDDVEIQSIKCYEKQNPNFLTEEFSINVEKYESTLEEMLWQLINETHDEYVEPDMIASMFSMEELLDLGVRYIYDNHYLHEPQENSIDIETVIHKIYSTDIILYQTFDIEIPAGESVTVDISLEKVVNILDKGGKRYQSFDLMTDSNLEFTSQKLTVEGIEDIAFAEDTTGEALEQGAKEVELNDSHFSMVFIESEN